MNSNLLRIMAIDYGEKRIGVASTDEAGQFAIPRQVFPNDDDLISKILEFIDREKIDRVIIGESKDFQNKPNPIQTKIEEFKKSLLEKGVETESHPEILTTMEARRIQGNTLMTDASAAALILKSYLDRVYNREI